MVREMSKRLNQNIIEEGIKKESIFSEVVLLDSVSSTQDYLFENADGLRDRAVVIAENQLSGYGRMGRAWDSSYGKGLYMSVLFKGRIKSEGLTMLGSLSLCSFLSAEYGLDFKMRWPNDVIYKDKKIAGVLANMSDGVIALGFGVNINQKHSELPDVGSSIFLLRGEEIDRDVFIFNFLNQLQKDLKSWEVDSFKYLRKLWSEFALFKGKDITAITRSGIIKGVVEDITEDYGLIIRTDMGYKTVLNFKELIKIR